MTSNLKNPGPILTYHSRGLKSISAESVTAAGRQAYWQEQENV